MLEESYRYARYVRSRMSLLFLSKVCDWVAATLEDPLPNDMKTRMSEMLSLLGSLMEEPVVAPAAAKGRSDEGCNTDRGSL